MFNTPYTYILKKVKINKAMGINGNHGMPNEMFFQRNVVRHRSRSTNCIYWKDMEVNYILFHLKYILE